MSRRASIGRIPLLAAVLLAGLVALPAPAAAYVVLKNWVGNTKAWSGGSVSWTQSPGTLPGLSSGELQTAIDAAFDAWQAVGCSTLAFDYDGTSTFDPGSGIHVTFQNGSWDPTVGDALAYAVSESTSGGTITSADVVFNGFDVSWSTDDDTPLGFQDVQAVATHEIGHAIGLGHSRELEATMWFSGGGPEGRTLEIDDQQGACFLYPAIPFADGDACDACAEHANCFDGLCLSWGEGHAYCGQDCTSSADCPEHFACYQISDDPTVSPQCLPDNEFCHQTGANVALGGFCYAHDVCASGFCLTTGEDAYCTQQCSGSCPSGLTCLGGLCLKAGSTPYGGACDSSVDCETSYCQGFTTGALCALPCGVNGGTCPPGDQCLQNVVCVPPGDGLVGSPCISPEQCAGTYCEGGSCTQACGPSAACPAGTTCVDGFCDGIEDGATCATNSDCPAPLTCFYTAVGEPGTCELECDPLAAASVCAAGDVCEWVWQDWSSTVAGRCVPATGGAGYEELCGPSGGGACELDLVCDDATWPGTFTCHIDCRLQSGGYGCEALDSCVSLELADDPKHGVCVPNNPGPAPGSEPDPGPEPMPEPAPEVPEDTGSAPDAGASPAPDPGGADDTAGPEPDTPEPGPDPGTEPPDGVADSGATPEPTPGLVTPFAARDSGGCGAAPHGDPAWALALLLVAAGAALGSRRRRLAPAVPQERQRRE